MLWVLFRTNSFLTSALVAAALVSAATWRDGWQKAVARGVAAVLFLISTMIGLAVLGALTPTTLDLQLYRAEAALGYPAIWATGFLKEYKWFGDVCGSAYDQLPLAIGIVWVCSQKARSDFRLFPWLGVFGWIGYLLMPAVGPAGINPDFLTHPDGVLRAAPPSILRNCMPSLHAAWLIALWWASESIPDRWRWICGLYCILALIETLGLGYHYSVDLAVAVPFTYGVRAGLDRRWRTFLYTTMVGAWFLALRLELFTHHPVFAWLAVASTIISCPLIHRLPGRQLGRSHPKGPVTMRLPAGLAEEA